MGIKHLSQQNEEGPKIPKKELTPEEMQKLADKLDEAQERLLISGRPIRGNQAFFVNRIITHLRAGRLLEARALYRTDGDKLSQFLGTHQGDTLEQILDEELGNPNKQPDLLK